MVSITATAEPGTQTTHTTAKTAHTISPEQPVRNRLHSTTATRLRHRTKATIPELLATLRLQPDHKQPADTNMPPIQRSVRLQYNCDDSILRCRLFISSGSHTSALAPGSAAGLQVSLDVCVQQQFAARHVGLFVSHTWPLQTVGDEPDSAHRPTLCCCCCCCCTHHPQGLGAHSFTTP